MEKYYVWYENDRNDCGYDNFEDAFNEAIANGATEIELTIWYDEESYENYEPADEFITVWKKSIDNV